jgi:hypothetical protein
MSDQVYYVVEDDHLERVEVRESYLVEDCLEVRFEGRDFYSPINKGIFLKNASTDRKEALRMLMKSLRNRQNYYQEQCSKIDKQISKICVEVIKL